MHFFFLSPKLKGNNGLCGWPARRFLICLFNVFCYNVAAIKHLFSKLRSVLRVGRKKQINKLGGRGRMALRSQSWAGSHLHKEEAHSVSTLALFGITGWVKGTMNIPFPRGLMSLCPSCSRKEMVMIEGGFWYRKPVWGGRLALPLWSQFNLYPFCLSW